MDSRAAEVREKIVTSIETAKAALASARAELAGEIQEIEGGRRADKRHVGDSLKTALARLTVAQNELAALEALLVT